MKKIIMLLAFTLTTASLWAQSSIDKFYQKYANDESFTVINITPKMFTMFSKVDSNDPDAKKVMQVAKKLTGLRILVNEGGKDANRLFHEASGLLSKDFEELMTIKDKETNLKFMVKENAKGNIAELIMLVGGDEFVALTITGDISLSEISSIAKDMDISGFDKLTAVDKAPKKK
ncbi:DUF4252 domain-containing protein [Chitinophaga horti]|uniref:DUF4252 domain-containing protein n=1 Tax=Chitinophaga horti TaxID=2920382 RepID=A0ABY6J6A3_9BACT|nr:DUF4252 domain-containing protein [Chitinophaga horti]UYQ95142.1 DUF4252 domain-containing protein [Chitinophaga horti]